MIMKKINTFFTASALAAIALTSCTKDVERVFPEPQAVRLTVKVGAVSTRASVQGNEDMTLNNFQVLVYNDAGKLEKSSNLVTGQTQLTLDVLPGEKTVWAVANIPAIISDASVPTPADLSARITDLSDNAINKLTMSGSASKTVSIDDSVVELELKHLACKVVIDGIKREFDNRSYAAIPLTVKKIYMSNVAGKCSIGCEGEVPGLWYNKLGVIPVDLPAPVKALTVDDGLDVSLPDGGSYNVQHTFYVYPNPSTEKVYGGSWSPRHTRLVLECDYGGRTCYYPVTLPAGENGTLQRNKVYRISLLTLTKPGTTSPDDPNQEVSSTIGFKVIIKVSDWEGDNSYTEEY